MSKNLRRRKPRLVIEKDFQFRFTLRICLVNGVLFTLFAGFFLWFIKQSYDLLTQTALELHPYQQYVQDLENEFRLLSVIMVGALVVLVVVLFVSGLYLTQQVAGPLFSLKARLRELADGKDQVRLHFRRNDEFQNLEEIFNFAMQRIEERREIARKKLLEAATGLESSGNTKEGAKRIRDVLEDPAF